MSTIRAGVIYRVSLPAPTNLQAQRHATNNDQHRETLDSIDLPNELRDTRPVFAPFRARRGVSVKKFLQDSEIHIHAIGSDVGIVTLVKVANTASFLQVVSKHLRQREIMRSFSIVTVSKEGGEPLPSAIGGRDNALVYLNTPDYSWDSLIRRLYEQCDKETPTVSLIAVVELR